MNKFKNILLISLLLLSFLTFSFSLAQSQNEQTEEIEIFTTGYSILSPNNYVWGGYYRGNYDKKDFTTYFEFKRGRADLDNPESREETIKIVRETDIEEENDFYSSPELNLFSTYYFRAVGYFNDKPEEKFYGGIASIRTGPNYISTIPFSYEVYLSKGQNDGGKGGAAEDDSTYDSGQIGQAGEIKQNKIFLGNFNITTTENTADIKTTIYNLHPENLSLQIEYGLMDDYDKTSPVSVNNKGEATVKLIGLEPDTKYYFYFRDVSNNSLKLNDSKTGSFSTQKSKENDNNPSSNGGTLDKVPTGDTGGLVKCGKAGQPECQFKDFIELLNTVINYIFKYLALPLAAIMFAYAGFELITSGGETSKKQKAKKIFINVAVGLVLAAAAFLIVKTILSIVGYDGPTLLE